MVWFVWCLFGALLDNYDVCIHTHESRQLANSTKQAHNIWICVCVRALAPYNYCTNTQNRLMSTVISINGQNTIGFIHFILLMLTIHMSCALKLTNFSKVFLINDNFSFFRFKRAAKTKDESLIQTSQANAKSMPINTRWLRTNIRCQCDWK